MQIAGLVARRIVCWAEPGSNIGIGERFGLIRFGSRVDVFLPADATPRVAVGQTAVAGETVLAEFGGVPGTPLVRVVLMAAVPCASSRTAGADRASAKSRCAWSCPT